MNIKDAFTHYKIVLGFRDFGDQLLRGEEGPRANQINAWKIDFDNCLCMA